MVFKQLFVYFYCLQITFIYKVKLSEKEIKDFNEIKVFRNKYKKMISELNDQIKFLRKTLHGREIKRAK